MVEDLSLKQFTSVDSAASVSTYVEALEAFDQIEQLQELKTLARRRGGFGPGRSILDVGCGFGLETLRLAAEGKGEGVVAGVDLSAEFIENAQQRAISRGVNVDFRVADAAALPYRDGTFDCVRAERLLIYLEDVATALNEMKRVLKSGGGLALIEPDFSTTTLNLANRSLLRKVMLHEVDTAVVQSWLPGQLIGLLPSLGFLNIDLASRVLVFPQDLAESYFVAVGRHAAEAGAIDADEMNEWLEAVSALARADQIFGTIGYFLFTARAP